jgi:hypothetical protein
MIKVTKQQAANTFWLSYHTHTSETIFHRMKHAFLKKQQLDIRHASIILKDKLCSVIGKMKPPISIMISGGVDSTLMLLMALECFDATQLKLFTSFCLLLFMMRQKRQNLIYFLMRRDWMRRVKREN